MYFLSLGLLGIRRVRGSRGIKTLLIVAALPLLLGFRFLDPGREAYDMGNKHFHKGDYENAEKFYLESTQEKPRAAAFYNLGNALVKQNKVDPAIQAYNDALAVDPHDEDAKHNLKLLLEYQKKQQEKKEQGDKGDSPDMPKMEGQEQQAGQEGQEGQEGQKGEGKESGPDGQASGQDQGKQAGKAEQKGAAGDKKAGDPNGELNQEEIQAMMNMLENDQKRYQQNFEPLKKHGPTQQELMQEMMRMRMPGQKADDDEKNW